MLLGRSVYENSNMDGAINAAPIENNYVLLYGDFTQFVIVDRIGSDRIHAGGGAEPVRLQPPVDRTAWTPSTSRFRRGSSSPVVNGGVKSPGLAAIPPVRLLHNRLGTPGRFMYAAGVRSMARGECRYYRIW
jgi:hypothetical protein